MKDLSTNNVFLVIGHGSCRFCRVVDGLRWLIGVNVGQFGGGLVKFLWGWRRKEDEFPLLRTALTLLLSIVGVMAKSFDSREAVDRLGR